MSKTVEDVLYALLKLLQCGLCLLHGCAYLRLDYTAGVRATTGGRPTVAAPSRAGRPGGSAPAAGSPATGAAPSRRRGRSRCGGRAISRGGGRRPAGGGG